MRKKCPRNKRSIRPKTKPATAAAQADPPSAKVNMIAGIILCGGRGTRMGRTRTHKVCVPVAGRPAIVRLIDTLRADGVDPLIVVIGHQAGEVIETVGAVHPGVHFVYQRDRLGTGHAARIGIEALCKLGYDGPVLITMGDKWLKPELVNNCLRRFRQSQADLLLVSTPKTPKNSSGRLVHLPGRGIVGIVELRDIERARVLRDWLSLASKKSTLHKEALCRLGLKRIKPAKKLWRALGPLATFCRGSGTVPASELTQVIQETGQKIRIGENKLGPEQVERYSSTVNQSIYIGKTPVLQSALRRIGRDNAQDEYYLTDALEIVASNLDPSQPNLRGKVVEYKLRRLDETMAFNTRAELEKIEEHVRRLERDTAAKAIEKRLAPYSRKPNQWLEILSSGSKRASQLIKRTYGLGGPLVNERLRALRKTVRLFARTYGRERKMFLVRAPGRINLMGRHIDHQGGFVHSMALDREVLMAVAPRNDDTINIVNTDPVSFGPRELVISDWRGLLPKGDWLSFVDGDDVRAHLMTTAGDWSNYVLASALYLQHRDPHQRICGMDLAISGNVPMAAGLSSSSAMVVASMEAIAAVNGLKLNASEIVDACGEAEWFVGSRGGAADHAAIRLSRAGYVARMGFHPFRISRYVKLPDNAAILIAYSGQHAVKSAGARDRFNERVACYRLGVLLLKRKYPRLASKLEYIRDLSPSRLGVTPAEVRKMIMELPAKISRREIRRQLEGKFSEQLEHIFSSHSDPSRHTVREVVTYGVGEYERSRVAAGYLERNNLEAFGELMKLSHNGDRVSGEFSPTNDHLPKGKLDSAPLYRLAGAYACSTENLDRIVDLAHKVPGVYGAQLAGAGLGGCVMILADQSAATRVKKTLAKEYYRPLGMAASAWEVRSVSGGGIIRP